MDQFVIGWDAATISKNVGLALARKVNRKWLIEECLTPRNLKSERDLDGTILQINKWVKKRPKTLIAIDAPLGWPLRFGSTIGKHTGGDALTNCKQCFFFRLTDSFAKHYYGKTPFSVNADKIARTTLASLKALQKLECKSAQMIWEPGLQQSGIIEVYPALTLRAHNYSSKKALSLDFKKQFLASQAIIDTSKFDLPSLSEHRIDAILCCIGGIDFLNNTVVKPVNVDCARKEGWIWVKLKDKEDDAKDFDHYKCSLCNLDFDSRRSEDVVV